jgi:hypothetical protein
MRAMDVKGQSKTLHFVAKRSVGERERKETVRETAHRAGATVRTALGI